MAPRTMLLSAVLVAGLALAAAPAGAVGPGGGREAVAGPGTALNRSSGPPIVRLVQRVTPAYIDAFTPAANTATRLRTVDARASSDPGGGSLSYAWDLDNDGEFDDVSDGAADSGVAIVPLAAFLSGTTVVSPTVRVRVSSSSGQSSTGTIQVSATGTPVFGREYDDVALTPANPEPGATIGLAVTATGGEQRACIDADGDGAFEASVDTSGGRGATSIIAGPAGGHVVLVTFTYAGNNCAQASGDADRIEFRAVYVSQGATQAATQAATLRVSAVEHRKRKRQIVVTSTARVSSAGKVAQRITLDGRTVCTTSATATAASSVPLTCTMGRKVRRKIAKGTERFEMVTTFTPTAGSAVSSTTSFKIRRG